MLHGRSVHLLNKYEGPPLGVPRDIEELVPLPGRLYVIHAFVLEPRPWPRRCICGLTFLIQRRCVIVGLACHLGDDLCRRFCEEV